MTYLNVLRSLWLPHLKSNRLISTSILRRCSVDGEESATTDDGKEVKKYPGPKDPANDRSKIIPVEESMRYMESSAYFETYGDDVVWKLYRRNHKYARPRLLTRATCIMHNMVTVGSPCPICRDEYLVLEYRNLKLLKQFISEHTNEVIDAYFTGICQKQHFALLVAVEKARDYGYIPFYVPKRKYNYEDYYPQYRQQKLN